MAKLTHSFTLTAPDSKKFALWVTMWTSILSVLHVLGIEVQASTPAVKAPKAKPVKPARAKTVKVSRAAVDLQKARIASFGKPTRTAKPAPVKRAVRKPAKPVQPVAVKVEPEPAFIEIPFSRETYRVRRQLGELGAKSNRAAKLWVIPAVNAQKARDLVNPPQVKRSAPVPVVATPAPVALPPAAKVEPIVEPVAKPVYIGNNRSEVQSWLASRGFAAPVRPIDRPFGLSEAIVIIPPAAQKPAVKVEPVEARKANPKAPDKRSTDERLATLSENAQPPSRRVFGRHVEWVREISLADLRAALEGIAADRKAKAEYRRNDRTYPRQSHEPLLFIAGDNSDGPDTSAAIPVQAAKRVVRLAARWKASAFYMNSRIGLAVRYDGKYGNSGHLVIATTDKPNRIDPDYDYVIPLSNDRESTKAA